MLTELRAKQALEKHLAQSDRLAALGRLSAGIAHEVNNPLGGMLNAISNHRRAGEVDARTERPCRSSSAASPRSVRRFPPSWWRRGWNRAP